MGFFTALNARVLAAIDRRAGVSRAVGVVVADDRLVVTLAEGGTRTLQWTDLRRVVGLQRDLYAGTELSVLLDFGQPDPVEIGSSVPGWIQLTEAIDALEGAGAREDWTVEVLAQPIGRGVTVWAPPDATADKVQ